MNRIIELDFAWASQGPVFFEQHEGMFKHGYSSLLSDSTRALGKRRSRIKDELQSGLRAASRALLDQNTDVPERS